MGVPLDNAGPQVPDPITTMIMARLRGLDQNPVNPYMRRLTYGGGAFGGQISDESSANPLYAQQQQHYADLGQMLAQYNQSKALGVQAQAAMGQVGVENAKLDPAYLRQQAALAGLQNQYTPPDERRQYRAQFGFAPTPDQIKADLTGQAPGAPPLPFGAATDRALARNPGGLAPDSPEAAEMLGMAPDEVASRLQGQPYHWYERELTGGPAGEGALNLGDVGQLGIPWMARNWINPMLHPTGAAAPTPRQLAERKIGALFPQGAGALKPGARLRAQSSDAPAEGAPERVRDRQAARRAREAEFTNVPSNLGP